MAGFRVNSWEGESAQEFPAPSFTSSPNAPTSSELRCVDGRHLNNSDVHSALRVQEFRAHG